MIRPPEGPEFLSIVELARRIGERDLSPTEVTSQLLGRIKRLNPRLAAYYSVFEDSALAEAEAATAEINAGRYRGPMHGIPVAVKDICEVGATTGGSRVRANYVAARDATVVAKLRDAGAVIVGKTATWEFALGRPTLESAFKPARNPWNTELDPGGSSSGSGAAVGAGMAYGAIGTDTGGSVRWPAFANGIVGMKATYGRVSRAGVFPLSWSLDHVGPMTRTVLDAAVMLQAISGYDPRDSTSARVPTPDFAEQVGREIKGLRLGVPWSLFESSCEVEMVGLFKAALSQLERLGAEVIDVATVSYEQVMAVWLPIMAAEAAVYHLPDFRDRPDEFGPYVRAVVGAGLGVSAPFYVDCQRAREVIRRQLLAGIRAIDAYVLPTAGGPVPKILDRAYDPGQLADGGFDIYTAVFNLTGFPAMSVPCGFSSAGMPVALQIASAPFNEATVVQIGHAFEQATDWHLHHPHL